MQNAGRVNDNKRDALQWLREEAGISYGWQKNKFEMVYNNVE
ncbi:hypothetical protein ACIFQM_00650 [Paenibacillus sp. NRS-1782]